MKTKELLAKIDILFGALSQRRPLNKGELQELQKALKVEFIYNSNAIEGNTLTRGETKLVIEDGLTVAGKTIREINETLNHNGLFDLLYEVVDQKKELEEALTLKVHQLVLKNIDDENAGQYRNIQVYISGDEIPPMEAGKVPKAMQDLCKWYAQNHDLHPVLLAGAFHYKFVKIHPFIDGNGRTARLLVNMILMARGYPLMVIPVVRRAEYIACLNSSSSQEKFMEFFVEVMHENMKDYVRMIE